MPPQLPEGVKRRLNGFALFEFTTPLTATIDGASGQFRKMSPKAI